MITAVVFIWFLSKIFIIIINYTIYYIKMHFKVLYIYDTVLIDGK